ncbi:UDP-3-O-(3-hydroxymyristoyl) glucosamine N-acyltransferase [Marinosulfonomonas sp. PRT-SC04]|nr:UDP-3-O-(3-hydroxymyristoyl) glucosamine N-acyltransferase [Marinosulfonomonas sp. PRT-SC04]
MQTTIKHPVSFTGIGLHSGTSVRMTVHPASAQYGIWFRRTDLAGDALIAARWDAVSVSRLCTKISNAAGASVSTIEHIMAALSGCGVQNVLIEIDGPEVPVLDGSSAQFVKSLVAVGLQKLAAPVRAIEVLQVVEVSNGLATARLEPAESLYIDFHIDFSDQATVIGRQTKTLNMANGAFVRELSDSRTFCLQKDVDMMRENGLALGGSVNNAVVIDGDTVLSPGGLRYRDEAVRHKMLDALGDLALAGAPLLARYTGVRAGHALTNKVLRKLFATPGAYRMVVCDAAMSARLPGVGLHRTDLPIVA